MDTDTKVAVLNRGPIQPELAFDGREYKYPVGKAVVVPFEIASFHFGIEMQNGRLVRDKKLTGGRNPGSYELRLGSYCPLGLKHGRTEERDIEKYKEFEKWFSDGIEFKIVRSTKELDESDFSKLK